MILLRISQRILIGFLQKNQYTYNVPPGLSNYIYMRGRRPSLRVDGMDGMGWDGVSKVSFNFLYTLCVCRSCLYAPIYVIKTCHQRTYGFQNLISSWGWGNIIFEITIFKWVFKYLVPKVDGYQGQINLWSIFRKFQKPVSSLCRPITYRSLRDPWQDLRSGPKGRAWWDGRDGTGR